MDLTIPNLTKPKHQTVFADPCKSFPPHPQWPPTKDYGNYKNIGYTLAGGCASMAAVPMVMNLCLSGRLCPGSHLCPGRFSDLPTVLYCN